MNDKKKIKHSNIDDYCSTIPNNNSQDLPYKSFKIKKKKIYREKKSKNSHINLINDLDNYILDFKEDPFYQKEYDLLTINKNLEICPIDVDYSFAPTIDRGTILIKTLLTIIETNEHEIVKFEKKNKKYGLSITNDDKIRRNYDGNISRTEIAKILGVSRETLMKRWLKYIEKGEKVELNFTTVAKMKTTLDLLSGTSAHKSFIKAFDCYETFIDRIYNMFIEYIDIPLGKASGTWISSLLKKYDSYLGEFSRSLLKEHEKEGRDKYINLLISIHLIEARDIRYPMRKGKSLIDFRKQCHNRIFREMKNRNMISDLTVDSNHKHYGKRILHNQVKSNLRDFFDIIIYSLIALTKAYRKKNPSNIKFIFSYTKLSKIISASNSSETLSNKFRSGTPLARSQCRRLIAFLRRYFFTYPLEFHNLIYKIRLHIIKYWKIWYWNKYNIHFWDLYYPQIKLLLDITLGLDLYNKSFMDDAHLLVKNGYCIEDYYVLDIPRHHIKGKSGHGYLIMKLKEDGKIIFKLTPLGKISHSKLHNLKTDIYKEVMPMIKDRLLHLFKLSQKKTSPTMEDFKENDLCGIWDGFSNNIIMEWIKRCKIHKNSETNFYKKYYNNFFHKIYLPLGYDYRLYKSKSSMCQLPEFWYWYKQYLKEEPLINQFGLKTIN